MSDVPRRKDGSVIPEEWFDNEPTYRSDEDLSKSYSEEFDREMDDWIKELGVEPTDSRLDAQELHQGQMVYRSTLNQLAASGRIVIEREGRTTRRGTEIQIWQDRKPLTVVVPD